MAQIGQAVGRVSDIAAEIPSASVEKSKGIEWINGSVSGMEHVTQENASLVEQAATASESMRAQAAVLVRGKYVSPGRRISALVVTIRKSHID